MANGKYKVQDERNYEVFRQHLKGLMDSYPQKSKLKEKVPIPFRNRYFPLQKP